MRRSGEEGVEEGVRRKRGEEGEEVKRSGEQGVGRRGRRERK